MRTHNLGPKLLELEASSPPVPDGWRRCRVAPPPLDPFRASVRADRRSGATGFQRAKGRNPSPISKNQKKEKRESAVRPGSACLSPAPGMRPWRGLATHKRRLVPNPGPLRPHIAKSETPAMTRPVAARIAHAGRTAALSGPHRLEVGCGRSPARVQFQKTKKRKRGGRDAGGHRMNPCRCR
jgi:hypothetical protein